MGLTSYLLLFILAMLGLSVWAIVLNIRQGQWWLAALIAAAFVAMVIVIYLALGELISRM